MYHHTLNGTEPLPFDCIHILADAFNCDYGHFDTSLRLRSDCTDVGEGGLLTADTTCPSVCFGDLDQCFSAIP